MSKYHAKKTEVDGIVFDSKKEAQRYNQLKVMERFGLICNLKRQCKYELVPAQYIDGKCVERAVTYVADFEYDVLNDPKIPTGTHIVEDVKGMRTKDYIIKRKLMLHLQGIRITEV